MTADSAYVDEMLRIQEASEELVRPNIYRLICPAIHECHNAVILAAWETEQGTVNAAFARLHKRLRKLLADIGEQPHLLGETVDDAVRPSDGAKAPPPA